MPGGLPYHIRVAIGTATHPSQSLDRTHRCQCCWKALKCLERILIRFPERYNFYLGWVVLFAFGFLCFLAGIGTAVSFDLGQYVLQVALEFSYQEWRGWMYLLAFNEPALCADGGLCPHGQ